MGEELYINITLLSITYNVLEHSKVNPVTPLNCGGVREISYYNCAVIQLVGHEMAQLE
jgi:hypothetical protein